MESDLPALPPVKRRRRFSAEFKAMAVGASHAPGASIASVAQQHNINPNLLQKWRKLARDQVAPSPSDFVQLAGPGTSELAVSTGQDSIRVDLPGGITVHWPVSCLSMLSPWLRTMAP